jgi:D-apiose dehydrogenase
MTELRFAVFGTGFWSRFQLAAWKQLPGVRCVAAYNRTRSKAEVIAREFEIPTVYDDAEALVSNEKLDFIDIITDVDSHARFVKLAAEHQLDVICQKPMASSLTAGEDMVKVCRDAGVAFYIHENWRWQTPIRKVKQLLNEGHIGQPFRAHISMVSGFPVFENQPFLKDLDQFVLTDMGSHVLDTARMLFGEAQSLYCQTHKVHSDIKGEDVATVMLSMCAANQTAPVTVLVEMGYAGTPLERERFPETSIFIEGELGSIELQPDYWVRLTTKAGTQIKRCPPPRYAWADPAYDVVHSSILPCNQNLLNALRKTGSAETSAEDNIKTVRLVFAAYDSARNNQVITLPLEV